MIVAEFKPFDVTLGSLVPPNNDGGSGVLIESAMMVYIIIDGDDIGRQITAFYLQNDVLRLSDFISQVHSKLRLISDFLESAGFSVIFCAADGVAARCETPTMDDDEIYGSIRAIGNGSGLTFSAGVGTNLREAYVALLLAKSSGKARICNYTDMV